MWNAIVPERGTESDRLAIQKAIDSAFAEGSGNVLIEGGCWNIDGPICLHEEIHLHLDGAELHFTGEPGGSLLQNSVIGKPRVLSKYGNQKGICVTGSHNAALTGGAGIYFYNAGEFQIQGLQFDCGTQNAVTLVYCSHGRVSDLEILTAETGIEVGIGTRNCFFTKVTGCCTDSLLHFTTAERREMVYYVGPDVCNHIVREISGRCGKALICLQGKYCTDIIINDAVNLGEREPGIRIEQADGISLCGIVSKQIVNEGHGCRRLYVQS